MTDFLTTLAARTLGLAPVIQPMISSIFSSGLVVFGDYGSGEMGGEKEYKGSSSLDQFSSPDLPVISRLPLSQISTAASEFNNIEFNDEMGKISRQQNIEPVLESANASTNQSSESLPVLRFSGVELKGSSLGGYVSLATPGLIEPLINQVEPIQIQVEISNQLENISVESASLIPKPTPNQENQKNINKSILPLTLNSYQTITGSVSPLINQPESDKIPVKISNQLENALPIPKLTPNQQPQENINKSIVSLTSSQTIIPSSVLPLINQPESDEIPVEISNKLESISAITKSTINKENQQNINKSILPLTSFQPIIPASVSPLINPAEADEIPVQISNQGENTSEIQKLTLNQENQQNINQSILPLPNFQSITTLLVEPLINSGLTNKLPESFIYRTAIGAESQATRQGRTPSRSVAPSTPRNKISREFLHKSSNQEEIDEIAVIGRGQEILTETLIDSAIPVSSSNEVGKLDKETKAKGMDNSKVKLSPSLSSDFSRNVVNLIPESPSLRVLRENSKPLKKQDKGFPDDDKSQSLSFPVSTSSQNVSTLQPSQLLTNVNIVVVKPLVDIRMNVNVQKQENSLKSANLSEYLSQYLSQYAAVKNQPVVLPQQLSVYSQFHTQMESRESGQTGRRGEGLTMEQAPTKTIQVTIGRIEVRCNQTASQTKHTKPNRSEPKLSLQDYLKKRQGGNS